MDSPIKTLLNFLVKVLRSMSYLTTFIASLRTLLCLFRFRSKVDIFSILLMCGVSCLGVLLEDLKRAEDYSVFTIPRVLEGIWYVLKKQGIVKDLPHMMKLVFALSIGLFLVIKVHYNKEMPDNYKSQLSFIFGKEEEETTQENTNDEKKENNITELIDTNINELKP